MAGAILDVAILSGDLNSHIEWYLRFLSFFDVIPSTALDLILLPITIPLFLL
jgi:hypothetical protein